MMHNFSFLTMIIMCFSAPCILIYIERYDNIFSSGQGARSSDYTFQIPCFATS